jgi:hypothetical protein
MLQADIAPVTGCEVVYWAMRIELALSILRKRGVYQKFHVTLYELGS